MVGSLLVRELSVAAGLPVPPGIYSRSFASRDHAELRRLIQRRGLEGHVSFGGRRGMYGILEDGCSLLSYERTGSFSGLRIRQ